MRALVLLPLLLGGLVLAQGCKKEAPPAASPAEAEHEEGHGHEGEAPHTKAITLTPEAVRNARLQTAEVQRKPLAVGLTVPARLAFPQRGVAQVAARVPGRIASIEVDLGERVKKGQILGYLESPDLGRARADYLAATMKAQVAAENFRREKELFAKGITSEREMREAEGDYVTIEADRNAADARLHALSLTDQEINALRADEHYSSRFPARSPLDGTVVEIPVTVGQEVGGTTPLFTVGDLSTLWALLDVSEAQLSTVQTGQSVDLAVQALPGKHFQGKVTYIGDLVDEKTRTTPVRVVLPNTEGNLKPGMFATAEISTGGTSQTGASPERLVVPREAVQQIADEQVVFVPQGPNQFQAVEVKTGASSATEIEILEGLEQGTAVVTQGAFILKSELSKESMGEGHSH
ncbi:efflux RND transporter periplasmic adaptor subunit [Stigmatella aurantiaca]|uniref:Heavy metal efflux pump, CzcB family n=1 Tax=Stigmatella aurantiaca (strain DW4/3-1) TaxID=378806 RepID=Q093I1_STIAD|nr:efflux RND transporter periplasmic adaptor subunit [Stigmatella aurantiaca]ADO75965.1 Heavy metal efflux pump, CzcB family [Stigmatella aurantiaca DW4/3-1]EAU66864.1 heavy metal efflux pump, CzcB family [Stigmatella aurantiaca DW4/3-1]